MELFLYFVKILFVQDFPSLADHKRLVVTLSHQIQLSTVKYFTLPKESEWYYQFLLKSGFTIMY